MNVYPPSDDTFLMLEALDADAERLRALQPRLCLEIGSGTGAISAGLGQICNRHGISTPYFFAVDKNPAAAVLSSAILGDWLAPGMPSDAVQGSLVQSLRIDGLVDLGLFNPPYVPTSPEE